MEEVLFFRPKDRTAFGDIPCSPTKIKKRGRTLFFLDIFSQKLTPV